MASLIDVNYTLADASIPMNELLDIWSVIKYHPVMELWITAVVIFLGCCVPLYKTHKKCGSDIPASNSAKALYLTIITSPVIFGVCNLITMVSIESASLFQLWIALHIRTLLPAFISWLQVLKADQKPFTLTNLAEEVAADVKKEAANVQNAVKEGDVEKGEGGDVEKGKDEKKNKTPPKLERKGSVFQIKIEQAKDAMRDALNNVKTSFCTRIEIYIGLYGAKQAAIIPVAVSFAGTYVAMIYPNSESDWSTVVLSVSGDISIGVALAALLLAWKGFGKTIPVLGKQFISVNLCLWSVSLQPLVVNAFTPLMDPIGIYTLEQTSEFYASFMAVLVNAGCAVLMSKAFTPDVLSESLSYASGGKRLQRRMTVPVLLSPKSMKDKK